MINDEKLLNTIKLLALKNAIDFNNNIKLDVIISKTFSYSNFFDSSIRKNLVNDVKDIVLQLNEVPIIEKKDLYDKIFASNNHYMINPEITNSKKELGVTKNSKEHNNFKNILIDTEQKFELPSLHNAKFGNVITRFPPEPNGYPHIGHAKAAIIDEEYAKKYGGKLILRYDDTNPGKEKLEYYDAIKKGLDWLKITPDIIKNTSDDLEILYKYARKLIEKNYAYVCECLPETIKQNRSSKIICTCTSNSIKDNLEKFNDMVLGKYAPNLMILRYRGNMNSLNTAMRDPTLFRILNESHPRLGKKYSLWPTYDFAAPIEDSLDGVTHAFRTKEYELRNELYFSILENLKLNKPNLIEFSRLEFEGIPVSKRKITPLIEKGIIKDWDDPRLPTLLGLERRGFVPEAIRKFVLSLSITLSETKPSIEILESFNRKILDPVSIRLFFVKDPVEVHIDNIVERSIEVRNHPNNLDLGHRNIDIGKIIYISSSDANKLKIGDTIRLMDLCNIEIKSIDNNKEKTIIEAKNIGNEISKKMSKIQWVGKNDSKIFKIIKSLPLFNGDVYNPDNIIIENGVCESYISTMSNGDHIQFIRYGFCRKDDDSTAIFTHK